MSGVLIVHRLVFALVKEIVYELLEVEWNVSETPVVAHASEWYLAGLDAFVEVQHEIGFNDAEHLVPELD